MSGVFKVFYVFICKYLTVLLLFQFGCLLFSFSDCFGRTSNTVLNKSCKSRHPCLVADLREKPFSFSPVSVMLTMGLSYVVFIMLTFPLYLFLHLLR